ncbi:type 4a pilus biogenesis protein PilO [Poriferisphaera sp. WC338]|uniref:type 4a pilus biogenesis protein PilO n=1 Tax=Poriferisphaera sp. WC338 TaxID=3425129 RepID=UPI003D8147AB
MRFGLREGIFVVLLMAMLIASYMIIFEPRNRMKEEAEAEIAQRQAKLQQLNEATKQNGHENLEIEIDRLNEAISEYEQKLPSQREVDVILKEVWQLADKHNLIPKKFVTGKINRTANYSEVPNTIVIIGDFDGFYSFLLDLEQLPRITRMPKIELKKINTDEGQMKADIVLSIYFDNQSKDA